MCDSNCGGNCSGHKCTTAMIGKILLIAGGINWGLVGLAMLFGGDNNWNVINLLLSSFPVAEAIVYVLVGIAAVVKIFGCRCSKCAGVCHACGPAAKTEGGM